MRFVQISWDIDAEFGVLLGQEGRDFLNLGVGSDNLHPLCFWAIINALPMPLGEIMDQGSSYQHLKFNFNIII